MHSDLDANALCSFTGRLPLLHKQLVTLVAKLRFLVLQLLRREELVRNTPIGCMAWHCRHTVYKAASESMPAVIELDALLLYPYRIQISIDA